MLTLTLSCECLYVWEYVCSVYKAPHIHRPYPSTSATAVKIMWCLVLVTGLCATAAIGQQVGNSKPENHPPLTFQSCTKSGGCQSKSGRVVIDANWRWVHNVNGYTNCFTGNKWNTQYCPDGPTCAKNCAVDGADYQGTYGVTTQGSLLRLNFVTQSANKNIGSRLYLLDSDTNYVMFKLKNKEFTFDVDVSNLPCGLNGALYLVEMDEDGGMGKYPGNKAGAKYGTGYCDAQCPRDIKFINGEGNCEDWKPSPVNPNTGAGKYGTCCNEMDIWESNSISTAYTPHVCSVQGQTRCTGDDCGNDTVRIGFCDKDGCDFNPYRLGDRTFFGPSSSFDIDSSSKFTVVTQFITADGTESGELTEIKRIWVQDGKVVQSQNVTVQGNTFNSVTDKFCTAQKKEFNDTNRFKEKGGIKEMGQSLEKGMVLVMSLWDDYAVHMLWLDSNYPTNEPASKPGVARGTCPTDSGKPSDVEAKYPNAYVEYSNIKYGEINSTY